VVVGGLHRSHAGKQAAPCELPVPGRKRLFSRANVSGQESGGRRLAPAMGLAFASEPIVSLLKKCRVVDEPAAWELSDHCPILLELSDR